MVKRDKSASCLGLAQHYCYPRFTIASSLMPLVPRLLNEEISKNGLFWSPFLLPSAFYHDCRGGLGMMAKTGRTVVVGSSHCEALPANIKKAWQNGGAHVRNDEIPLLRQTCADVQSVTICGCCSSRSGGALPSLSWPAYRVR
jgi:hypothetical protein